ncbi:NrfD/PsrC family molybdoenzyme membrane anchor subunit [Desulfomonile tiedjei]|uniref:Polysulfide reductase n=1 Tax=Desulfomonile tiedjei (strain ATCC 49306 / DSM 6799 / DCB-1) TaxID=706587 RepID=I4CEH9_DESTA|nr:NrfD/PsrC family molybdoenzyme membrane anchor subunit [Desulfomonile tiedjei]AFM27970.1 polysulfide reductase [Desulfomonile tiedjei DSM 6799]
MANMTLSTRDSGHGASASPWKAVLWVIWLILMVTGLIGVFQRFGSGHLAAGYGSYVPWGLWIGLYFLGVGISGGSFIIGAVGYIFGVPGFSRPSELRIAIVLSLAALIPAFIGVALDLGRTERLIKVLTSPTFTSMMAFNAWMYNIFIVVAAVSWLLTFKVNSSWLKPLLIFGAFLSILFPSQSGVFFEAVRTNEFWHSPILSVLFLASAIALGAAGLILVRALLWHESASRSAYDNAVRWLRTVAIVAILVYLAFEFAEFSIVLWNPGQHSPSVDFLLFGDYRQVFWILHLLVGALIPLALFATNHRGLWVIGALLTGLGFAAARMCILVPGQIAGHIPGLQQAFQDARLTYSYHPTSMEYLIGFFMVAVGMAIFYLGIRLGRTFASSPEHGYGDSIEQNTGLQTGTAA